MNNNKNIKLSSFNSQNQNMSQEIENQAIITQDNNGQIDTTQMEPAYTHTMVVNVRDENDNIIPTTVTLKFFFTSKNPNNAPIYAEFTKVDNNNHTVYSQNFSFTGVEDMSAPIANAILDSNRDGASSQENNKEQEADSDDESNLDEIDKRFKLTLRNYKSKESIKKVLKENFHIEEYCNLNNYQEIFTEVSKKCSKIDRLGVVACYNISADICRNYNLPVDNLYLIDKNTKEAINSINISTDLIKTKKIGSYSVKYIALQDLKDYFTEKEVTVPFESNNAYHYEIFLQHIIRSFNKANKAQSE